MTYKLLDLFCGAGGCSMGYHRAGFEVVGVDSAPQKNYPFEFHQADALEYPLDEFDVIHASPPCQAYSTLRHLTGKIYPDLVAKTREKIKSHNYVIENVKGAPLKTNIMLCGTMFGLKVFRHRYFECNPELFLSPYSCNHNSELCEQGRMPKDGQFITVTGHFAGIDYAKKAMGIDWMTQKELSQAIPPAYTEYIGKQIISILDRNNLTKG